MSTVLGLHYGHHGTVCIVRNGRLIAALSSERLSRHKFSHGVTDGLLDYVFSGANMSIDDIDYVALSDWHPMFRFHEMTVRRNGKDQGCLWNTVYDNTLIELEVSLKGKTLPAFHIGHQLAHAAAAFYTSPFDKAYCFTLDASGAKVKNNSLISYGDGKKLTSLYCPGLMIGVAYGFFTEFLGIGHQLFKAGSTMALAGYGKLIQRVEQNLQAYVNQCFFPDQADYHQWYLQLWRDLSESDTYFSSKRSTSDEGKNIASTLQHIFEQSILQCINNIDAKGATNLCLGGGSMLNCCANSLILRESQFKDVHLFPGCGDDGGAVGTALYVAHHILSEERVSYTDAELCYLGPEQRCVEPDVVGLAKELVKGKIVAWSMSRSEFGPRALGHRSLLSNPRTPVMRALINDRIKYREWYRPLAPVVLEEEADKWFDLPIKSPFMLFTAPIKSPELIPSATHIDNSARHQTISKQTDPYYYQLIKEFQNITDVPILINTSLNGKGEPIVETEEHALNFFNNQPLVDILVLNGTIYRKEK